MVLPMSSTATAPADVTITMALVQGPFDPETNRGTNTGTWSASGAFTDEGTVVENYHMHLSGDYIMSSTTEDILTAADGSSLIIHKRLGAPTITSPPGTWGIALMEGTWEIVSGTGRYEQAVGHGTFSVVVNIKLAWQGKVSNFVTCEGVAKP